MLAAKMYVRTWMDEDFIGRVGSSWYMHIMHSDCTGVTCMGECGCMKPLRNHARACVRHRCQE